MIIFLGGILSYLLSLGIDFYHMCVLAKDYAEQGYKIKYQEYRNNLNESNFNLRYFPYLNLIPAIKSFSNYIKNRENIIRRNIFSGSVEVFSDKERINYNKKRTALNAFRINASSIVHERMAHDLAKEFDVPVDEAFIVKKEFTIDDENVIFYQMDMLNSEQGFTITSSKGERINKLSKDEQLQIIYDYYDLLNEKIDEYVQNHYNGDKKRFEEEVLNNKLDIEPLKEELKTDYLQDVITKKLK